MSHSLAGRARKVALALAASGVATLAMSGSAMAGAFVVSPQSVAQGTSVYFWGAQWPQYNQVKGSVPSSFKGYADTVDLNTLGNCGHAVPWQTDPGSSTPPPATLDATLPFGLSSTVVPGSGDPLAVVVTADTITKSGSTITGSDSHGAQVWFVDVTSNYAPDAGHEGYGKAYAPICNAADVASGTASAVGGSVSSGGGMIN